MLHSIGQLHHALQEVSEVDVTQAAGNLIEIAWTGLMVFQRALRVLKRLSLLLLCSFCLASCSQAMYGKT